MMRLLPLVGWVGLLAGCARSSGPPGILLISMDTTRYDATSLGSERNITPNLARLAQQGTTFTHAFSVANESVTSHAALFTGRYPSELAIAEYGTFALPAGTPTLAAALQAHGWQTAAFTGGGHVVPDFGLHQGFGTFEAVSGAHTFGSFFDTVPQAMAWVARQDGPWFAFVHGYDAHTPYQQRGPLQHPWGAEGSTARIEQIAGNDLALEQLRGPLWFRDRTPSDFTHAAGRTVLGTDFYRLPAEPAPDEWVELLSDDEVAHLRLHYDAGVHYADLWLGVLLASVDLERTLVIVLSDHGEDLLDHGYINHRAGLWDSTLRIPLVVAGPGIAAGRVVETPVDLRSIVPTILHHAGVAPLAGASAPLLPDGPTHHTTFAEGTMDEISAAAPGLGRLTLHRAGLATGARTVPDTPSPDRATWYPPGSTTPGDLSASQPQLLLDRLRDWRSALTPATHTGVPVSPALREALQERGYWVPKDSEDAP